jgi:DNA (cytosine-5)-methyltransferase 1
LPQKRERVFIVGLRAPISFKWPKGGIKRTPLAEILETKVDRKFYASKKIRSQRKSKHRSEHKPSIWHENKAGHISSYPYSCALRAGASYNYLLVDGKRRLTPREMLRLQGFPDNFRIVCNDSQTRKQAGNAVPVPAVEAILRELQSIWPALAAADYEEPAHAMNCDHFELAS